MRSKSCRPENGACAQFSWDRQPEAPDPARLPGRRPPHRHAGRAGERRRTRLHGAEAAAAWHEGVALTELHAEAPFLEISALAAAHERGPGHAVAEKWRRCLEPDPYEDLEMIRAARAEPRLRALFPFTSHGTLMFSRCTGWPFSSDVSAIRPLADGRYAVLHRNEESSRLPSCTAQEAAALVASRLQETWGPAVAGTEHDLRDREGR
ncbi:DUF6193 family natural product biosynthesis protein [Streptomyces sp. NPDC002540]